MPRKKKQPYGLAAHRAARKYETAVKPYAQVWEKLKLPKRGPPGSPQNYERVFIIAEAMRRRKMER
jgi:hypothetical protein